MPFAQLIVGPPGSGKSTYCHAQQQMCRSLSRQLITINLDPGNDALSYHCDIDICSLITIADVQTQYQLGPNGALMYCMEYLESNIQWLIDSIQTCINKNDAERKPTAAAIASGDDSDDTELSPPYLLIDMPGQVELYTHHRSIHNIVHSRTLSDQLQGMQFVCVHLIDALYITDVHRYISVCLLSLHAMIQLELPHINVLSKIDLLLRSGAHTHLAAQLQQYVDVVDIRQLVAAEMQHNNNNNSSTQLRRYSRLTAAICELVDDYGMVSFLTLDVTDTRSMLKLLKHADKANGYVWIDEIAAVTEEEEEEEQMQQQQQQRQSQQQQQQQPRSKAEKVTAAMLAAVGNSESDFDRIGSLQQRYDNEHDDINDDSSSSSSDELDADDAAMIENEQIAQAKAAERMAMREAVEQRQQQQQQQQQPKQKKQTIFEQ